MMLSITTISITTLGITTVSKTTLIILSVVMLCIIMLSVVNAWYYSAVTALTGVIFRESNKSQIFSALTFFDISMKFAFDPIYKLFFSFCKKKKKIKMEILRYFVLI
jgi:hypothetical protein